MAMAEKRRTDPIGDLVKLFYRKNKALFILIVGGWGIFAVLWILFNTRSLQFVSPLVDAESCAQSFLSCMSWSKYPGVVSISDQDHFSLLRDSKTNEEAIAYSNKIYNENIRYLSSEVPKYMFKLRKFPWEKLPDDHIIDYWIQGFKASEEKEVFSVCYRFKSGAVLQVADLYEIYGKPEKTSKPHKYRVVRMFFVGTKYKKYFPHAYFDTEANIQHYKQLMKEGKGWVRQANRYIDEKDVKEEEPILDYRTNPDYYKPLSQREE